MNDSKRSANANQLFIGLDVQIKRGVPFAVLDQRARAVRSGWFEAAEAPSRLAELIDDLGPERSCIGIDAPRMPLRRPREWSFRKGGWERVSKGMVGRHCEVAIKSLGLANPQWTPMPEDAPEWMRLGFDLFAAAEQASAKVAEVFPSATYRALALADDGAAIELPLNTMLSGPKDMLDAFVGAFTALRFFTGLGSEVGGGDGMGTIVLPTQVDVGAVGVWPGSIPGE